jgi:hypothetical protein
LTPVVLPTEETNATGRGCRCVAGEGGGGVWRAPPPWRPRTRAGSHACRCPCNQTTWGPRESWRVPVADRRAPESCERPNESCVSLQSPRLTTTADMKNAYMESLSTLAGSRAIMGAFWPYGGGCGCPGFQVGCGDSTHRACLPKLHRPRRRSRNSSPAPQAAPSEKAPGTVATTGAGMIAAVWCPLAWNVVTVVFRNSILD